ncbi:MAG: sulfurtransferase [Pseudomonadales bacterium]|nr:sulfurtransferase [Pseudomonadales bacterium]
MIKTIVSAEELHSHVNDPDWFVFDCRFSLADEELGRRQYAESHIPGAQYADLNKDLSDPVIPGKTGRHPLPERDRFLARVRQWGVTAGARVVAYDDAGGAFAARLWWLFRWLGHDRVAVLDGGLNAWQRAGFPLANDETQYEPSHFEAGEPLTLTVGADEIPDTDAIIIDARDEARYRGEAEPIDPVAGHIPAAICVPFAGNLTATGEFHTPDQLAKRFGDAGVSEDRRCICYCGSGVTAAHNILAMVHAGLPEPILYPGSWSEWITNPERPVSRS